MFLEAVFEMKDPRGRSATAEIIDGGGEVQLDSDVVSGCSWWVYFTLEGEKIQISKCKIEEKTQVGQANRGTIR